MDNKEKPGDNMKNLKRRLALRIVCAAATLLILIFSIITLGWFTNSAEDDVNSVSMAAASDGFELAAAGSDGRYDAYIDADNGTKLENVLTEDSTPIDLVAASGGDVIKWMMNDESNMENRNNGLSAGISPGSHGMLSFYVIPKQSGSLDITFSLETVLYDSNIEELTGGNTNQSHIITDSKAAGLVKGHILFFENYDESTGIYSDRITDSGFKFSRTGLTADTAYRVDFYWIWPTVADQLILPSGDEYLTENNFRRIIADDDDTFYDDILSSADNYFLDTSDFENTESMLDSVKIGSASDGFDAEAYKKLNTQWNDADQKIGISVAYIELKLSAG